MNETPLLTEIPPGVSGSELARLASAPGARAVTPIERIADALDYRPIGSGNRYRFTLGDAAAVLAVWRKHFTGPAREVLLAAVADAVDHHPEHEWLILVDSNPAYLSGNDLPALHAAAKRTGTWRTVVNLHDAVSDVVARLGRPVTAGPVPTPREEPAWL